MAALAIEVPLGVVFRTIGMALAWYDEVAAILLAWLTYYGSALAAVKRGHISCPELVAIFPPALRLPLALLAEVLVFGFFILLAYTGWSILEVLATDHLVSLPEISVNYVQSVIPIGAVLILIGEALNLPAVYAEARHGHGGGGEDKAKEASH
ncbi:MAG: TRAP transporter small permease subunit [Betaproteobacteria bacterium]|nr:TRAP transporter small permease subunit [Betaproteobacteria bacterium]